MREEYMIEKAGNKFVLYAGLLDEAHERGLRSIETELLQVPSVENGEVAIARAVVRTEDGKYSGIGDASPENVGRAIAPHIIRMAETRAKARALRDAINVGVTAFEELGEGSDESGDAGRARPHQVSGANAAKEATEKQIRTLIGRAEKAGVNRPALEQEIGKPVASLTRAEASTWIGNYSTEAGAA